MSNEDKSREIAEKRKVKYDGIYSSYLDCYISALEMAELKDKQFIEFVKKHRGKFASDKDMDVFLILLKQENF